jgi:hypothetical protein
MLLARPAHADEKRPDDGYAGWIVFADALAASIPLVLLATDAARQSLVAGDPTPVALAIALAPIGPAIVSPIMHGAHDRRDAEWISALGWGGAVLLSGASSLLLIHSCSVSSSADCAVDPGRAAAVMAIAGSLTVAMTIGDSQLARGHVPPPRASLSPTFAPVRGGGVAGLGGTF